MKIICENKKEYDDLMKACRYLHDYDFQKEKDRKYIDTDKHPILSELMHLYLDGKDFPDKAKYVTIKKKKK